MLALALAALLVEPLADRHRLWLSDEVRFLIGSDERARFETLTTDDARDAFIEAFWRRRDPSPDTQRNEAREEHARRRAASDRLFGPPDRGRLSERGRVYQLLGPPAFRESFPSFRARLVPVELWHYRGLTVPFLPESFYLVFFRRAGQGPFRIWRPVVDGPEALVRDPEPGRFQLEEGLSEIARVDPELAAAVGDGLVAGPLSRSIDLLASLEGFADLADREREARGFTRAAADFTRLRASLDVAVLLDDAGVAELHYALALAPGESERLSWRRAEGGFRSRVAIVGRLSSDARELERWEDELELVVDGDSLDALRPLRFSFRGRRPLAAAARRVELSLASPGGAFVVSERELPDAGVAVVAGVAELEGVAPELPFRLGSRVLTPGAVPAGSDAIALCQFAAPSASVSWELSSTGGRLWSASEPADAFVPVVERWLPTAGLPVGAYRLLVRAGDHAAETSFRIEDTPLGDERVLARALTGSEQARYRKLRAEAFLRSGRRDLAIEEMERTVVLLPGVIDDELELATLRFAHGRCEEVLGQLQPLAADARDPDVFVLLAACSEALGDARRAEESYERALELSPDDDGIQAALERLRRRNN